VALPDPFNRDILSVFRRFGAGNLILLLSASVSTSLSPYILSSSLSIVNIS